MHGNCRPITNVASSTYPRLPPLISYINDDIRRFTPFYAVPCPTVHLFTNPVTRPSSCSPSTTRLTRIDQRCRCSTSSTLRGLLPLRVVYRTHFATSCFWNELRSKSTPRACVHLNPFKAYYSRTLVLCDILDLPMTSTVNVFVSSPDTRSERKYDLNLTIGQLKVRGSR